MQKALLQRTLPRFRAATASPKESDLHKMLGLCSTPTNGWLIGFVHPTANMYGCWPHWDSRLRAERKNEKNRFLLRKWRATWKPCFIKDFCDPASYEADGCPPRQPALQLPFSLAQIIHMAATELRQEEPGLIDSLLCARHIKGLSPTILPQNRVQGLASFL